MSNQAPNVLVVDTNESVLQFAVAAVNKVGYVAVGRKTAESALALLRTTPSLQVVLSDICLESVSGPEFVRQALRDRPELKVVFMTGGVDSISFRRTDPVLAKPFDLRDLQEAIDTVLHHSHPAIAELLPAYPERRRLIAPA